MNPNLRRIGVGRISIPVIGLPVILMEQPVGVAQEENKVHIPVFPVQIRPNFGKGILTGMAHLQAGGALNRLAIFVQGHVPGLQQRIFFRNPEGLVRQIAPQSVFLAGSFQAPLQRARDYLLPQ